MKLKCLVILHCIKRYFHITTFEFQSFWKYHIFGQHYQCVCHTSKSWKVLFFQNIIYNKKEIFESVIKNQYDFYLVWMIKKNNIHANHSKTWKMITNWSLPISNDTTNIFTCNFFLTATHTRNIHWSPPERVFAFWKENSK